MSALEKEAESLRKLALGYPETYEEQPWGDRVVKVRGKIFLFCGVHEGQIYVSVKLPSSGRGVIAEGLGTPTAYGLGKAGWVSAKFASEKKLPRERVAAWIDESYRAVAPTKLVRALDDGGAKTGATKTGATKTGAAKTGATKAKQAAASDAAPSVSDRRVILLAHDALRAKRAVRAFAPHLALDVTDDPSVVRKRAKSIDGAILDLGRNPGDGIALVAELDASDHPILLFVSGVRDARQRRDLRARAESADLFGEPPGDPAVVSAVVAMLARYPRRSSRK